MEVVGSFVGLDADGSIGGAVDGGEELVEGDFSQMREEFLGARIPLFPEGARAANVVFPEAGLGFVDAEGDGLAGGEMEVGGGEALLVEAVAGFVHDAEEGGGEVVVFVAGGEADVGGAEGSTEGVLGGIDTALGEFEAKGFGDFAVEGFLGPDGAIAVEEVGGDGVGGIDRGGGDLGEFGVDGVEEGGDFTGFGTAFVFGEKGVVGLVFVTPVIGFLAGDLEEFFKVGSEGGEVIFFASPGPGGFGEGGGLGIADDEFLREFGGASVLMGEFALVGRVEGGEAIAEFSRGLEFVNATVEVGDLFGTVGNRSSGSVGFLIPIEGGGGGG